jgi:hypothetical protein
MKPKTRVQKSAGSPTDARAIGELMGLCGSIVLCITLTTNVSRSIEVVALIPLNSYMSDTCSGNALSQLRCPCILNSSDLGAF